MAATESLLDSCSALHSSALLADAAHGLSDLVGDFAVLICWTVSRKPPSPKFQFGYGKFESLGSLVVSIFLLLGGFGIGACLEVIGLVSNADEWLVSLDRLTLL